MWCLPLNPTSLRHAFCSNTGVKGRCIGSSAGIFGFYLFILKIKISFFNSNTITSFTFLQCKAKYSWVRSLQLWKVHEITLLPCHKTYSYMAVKNGILLLFSPWHLSKHSKFSKNTDREVIKKLNFLFATPIYTPLFTYVSYKQEQVRIFKVYINSFFNFFFFRVGKPMLLSFVSYCEDFPSLPNL